MTFNTFTSSIKCHMEHRDWFLKIILFTYFYYILLIYVLWNSSTLIHSFFFFLNMARAPWRCHLIGPQSQVCLISRKSNRYGQNSAANELFALERTFLERWTHVFLFQSDANKRQTPLSGRTTRKHTKTHFISGAVLARVVQKLIKGLPRAGLWLADGPGALYLSALVAALGG